ncbi:hypothetical protein MTO96_007052 [Rhipicephalus appendiculatus]
MPPKCRKSSRHTTAPKTRGRPRLRLLDRNAAYHRRRLSDSQWRAEMSSSFNTLRCLVLPSSVRTRRHRCRRAVLQAAVHRLRYLEGLVSELLANDADRRAKPRNIREVRSQFRRNLETAVPPLTRRERCRSEQSSQELPPSLEVLEECDQEEFTGVREAGGASNRADAAAAISEPSSPTICQVWWSNRAVEAAIMSSPTVKSLMESFYDDAPLPTIGLNSAQIVPDGVMVLEACPPSDPDDEHLVPVATLGANFDSSNLAASSEAIVSEDPLLSSAIVHSANSPENLNDVPDWSAEQVIIGPQLEWHSDANI